MNKEQEAQARSFLEEAKKLDPTMQPMAIAYLQGMTAAAEVLMKERERV